MGQKHKTQQSTRRIIRKTRKYTVALGQIQVFRGEGATIPAPTMQFTLNTTVDLGGSNLVPRYTREL